MELVYIAVQCWLIWCAFSEKNVLSTSDLTHTSSLHCRSIPVLPCGRHVSVIVLSHQPRYHFAAVCLLLVRREDVHSLAY